MPASKEESTHRNTDNQMTQSVDDTNWMNLVSVNIFYLLCGILFHFVQRRREEDGHGTKKVVGCWWWWTRNNDGSLGRGSEGSDDSSCATKMGWCQEILHALDGSHKNLLLLQTASSSALAHLPLWKILFLCLKTTPLHFCVPQWFCRSTHRF